MNKWLISFFYGGAWFVTAPSFLNFQGAVDCSVSSMVALATTHLPLQPSVWEVRYTTLLLWISTQPMWVSTVAFCSYFCL
jgi:hypothetical protein